jgi:PEGA domain-containing protein
MTHLSPIRRAGFVLVFLIVLFTPYINAQNQVLGEVQLQGTTDAEKAAGVWADGQYVGYLKELKGKKKILLLPGEHQITVRQAGYLDFTRKVILQPGEKQLLSVALQKDTRVQFPTVTAEIRLAVNPNRAAVFVDGVFVGHVGEFNGVGKALLVAPGKRKIKISLAGYETFENEVTLTPNQKFQIKTDLAKAPVTASSSNP